MIGSDHKIIILFVALLLTIGSVGCTSSLFSIPEEETAKTVSVSVNASVTDLLATESVRYGNQETSIQVVNMSQTSLIELAALSESGGQTPEVAAGGKSPTPASPAPPSTAATTTPSATQATPVSPTPIKPTPLPTHTPAFAPTATSLPSTGAAVAIESAAVQPPNCSTTPTTALRVSRVLDLQGVEFKLQFNPQIAQVVDADPGKEGVQIALGDVFKSQNNFVAVNQVDQNAGVIEFAAVLVGQQSFSGDGALAEITWQARQGGVSDLALTQVNLASPGGGIIQAAINNGKIEVSAECGGQ